MGDIIEEAFGGHLGGIWRHLGGIWETSARHLGDLGGIWGASGMPEAWAPKATPRWSEYV